MFKISVSTHWSMSKQSRLMVLVMRKSCTGFGSLHPHHKNLVWPTLDFSVTHKYIHNMSTSPSHKTPWIFVNTFFTEISLTTPWPDVLHTHRGWFKTEPLLMRCSLSLLHYYYTGQLQCRSEHPPSTHTRGFTRPLFSPSKYQVVICSVSMRNGVPGSLLRNIVLLAHRQTVCLSAWDLGTCFARVMCLTKPEHVRCMWIVCICVCVWLWLISGDVNQID